MFGGVLSLEETLINIFFTYFGIINIISFGMMGTDKYKAINLEYRIPEKRLFFIAWIGGALGVLIAMKFFRHKTLHNSFRYGIPAILLVTYSACYFLYWMLHDYLLPMVSTFLDKAQEGGPLFYILYPFLLNRGEIGSDVYWSAVWMVFALIWLLGLTYYLLSKSISKLLRAGLVMLNIYLYILMVYKCFEGVSNAGTLLKAIFLLILPLTMWLVRGFVMGFINGVKEEMTKGKPLNRKGA